MDKVWLLAFVAWLLIPRTMPAVAQIADAPVESLVSDLTSGDGDKKRDAVYELVRRGEYSAAVIEAFAAVVGDQDSQVRFQALIGLARAGTASAPAIPALIERLGDRDDQVRFRAADALAKIGTAAIEPLLKAWDDASNDAKAAICQALATIGPEAERAVQVIAGAIESDDDRLTTQAAEALVTIQPGSETLILKLSDSPRAEVRKVGIMAISNLTEPTDDAVARLQAAADDAEAKVREIAILALSKSMLDSQIKADLIERGLADVDASVRAAAVVAMRKAGLVNGTFAARIAGKINDAEPAITNSLVRALGTIGPDAKGTLPTVLAAIDREGLDPQPLAATLAGFGETVVPELLDNLATHPDREPVLSQALTLIGAPAIPVLLEGMDGENEWVRIAATRALGRMDQQDDAILTRLIKAIDDPSPTVRQIAVISVIRSPMAPPTAQDIQQTMTQAMRDTDPKVRAAAIQSIVVIDFDEPKSISAMESALADPAAEVRESVLGILARLPGGLAARLDCILTSVSDPSPAVRLAAVRLLAELPGDRVDEAVIMACQAALGDEDRAVKLAVTESIAVLALKDSRLLEPLKRNLNDDAELLRATLGTISGYGNTADVLVPELTGLLAHPRGDIRMETVNTLAAVEQDKGSLVRQLRASLDDSEWEVRRAAGINLGKLGAQAVDAVPRLFELLANDQDSDFASGALREINTAPVDAIPLLIEKLDSDDRQIAYFSALLLGKIGPPAREALPKLEEQLEGNGGERRSGFRKTVLREAIIAINAEGEPQSP